jgi:hypothetical protein
MVNTHAKDPHGRIDFSALFLEVFHHSSKRDKETCPYGDNVPPGAILEESSK